MHGSNMQNQIGSAFDQSMKMQSVQDGRPKLGDLITAAHSALDNLEGAVSSFDIGISSVMEGESVMTSTGQQAVPPPTNPPAIEDLMRVVLRIQQARSRIDGMAQRTRI